MILLSLVRIAAVLPGNPVAMAVVWNRFFSSATEIINQIFPHFGIAGRLALAELAGWIRLPERHRTVIHTGRVVRIEMPDDSACGTAWPRRDRSAAQRIPAGR